jgi:hypothetical protein
MENQTVRLAEHEDDAKQDRGARYMKNGKHSHCGIDNEQGASHLALHLISIEINQVMVQDNTVPAGLEHDASHMSEVTMNFKGRIIYYWDTHDQGLPGDGCYYTLLAALSSSLHSTVHH